MLSNPPAHPFPTPTPPPSLLLPHIFSLPTCHTITKRKQTHNVLADTRHFFCLLKLESLAAGFGVLNSLVIAATTTIFNLFSSSCAKISKAYFTFLSSPLSPWYTCCSPISVATTPLVLVVVQLAIYFLLWLLHQPGGASIRCRTPPWDRRCRNPGALFCSMCVVVFACYAAASSLHRVTCSFLVGCVSLLVVVDVYANTTFF
jgi:hypothetical protein